jgi:SAM-dependent methyltransferase
MYYTSLHRINADSGLALFGKIFWVIFNFINNLFPTLQVDPRLNRTTIKEIDYEFINNNIDKLWSPSRLIGNYFWSLTLPWNDISLLLNKEANILEIGCGSGLYGDLLKKYLKDDFKSYLGIDVFEDANWENYQNNEVFKFQIGNANSISHSLNGKNLIITQSALEHFDEDLKLFKQISNYVDKVSYPVIQIHLMPSAACLFTFLGHGIRQYTPRTISKITKLFGVNTFKTLYSLGGPKCNKVHRKYITYPILLRRGDQRKLKSFEYISELQTAIKSDIENHKYGNESFYALILQSHTSDDFTNKPINYL